MDKWAILDQVENLGIAHNRGNLVNNLLYNKN